MNIRHLIVVIGLLFSWSHAGLAVDLEQVKKEIHDGAASRAGTESAKVRTLLATTQDPDGSKAFNEFANYMTRYEGMQDGESLDVRALYRLYSETKTFKDGGAPAALAFRLFAKTTFPIFMSHKPETYMVEGALLELNHVRYLGEGQRSYFADEMAAGRKYLLENPQDSAEFLRYIKKTRDLQGWPNALPKEKMARIDAIADLILKSRNLFKGVGRLSEILKSLEEKDPKGANSIDEADLMMRMTEKVQSALKVNPKDMEARANLDLLISAAAGWPRPTRSGSPLRDAVADAIQEESRTKTDPVHRDNDVRTMKNAMVLERLREIATDPTDRADLTESFQSSLSHLPHRPTVAKGCLDAYRLLREKGFYSISAPYSN